MPKYITQQRKALLHYLSEHPDEHLSTRQIAQALAAEKISLSAVYRNLAALEAEGKVRRCARPGTREVFYQYTDAAPCKGVLHMTCTQCGQTFHLSEQTAAWLTAQMDEREGFARLRRNRAVRCVQKLPQIKPLSRYQRRDTT